MTHHAYPPVKIVANIKNFFQYRDIEEMGKGLTGEPTLYTSDKIVSDMERQHYVRLDGQYKSSKDKRDWVVVFVLNSDGKYAHGPELKTLINSVNFEPSARAGRLYELIIVADEVFFSKKNLIEIIKEYQKDSEHGIIYTLLPYHNFACIIPAHLSVPKHRILAPEELQSILQREHITRLDLPVILTTDAPIVWLGAREGQVVEILRPSETAGESIMYRRVERGQY